MAQFSNAHKSHEHSQGVLNLLREHDTFIESISSVADMGAGGCLDIQWWSELTTRDEQAEALNLKCYAVDRAPLQIDFDLPKNITYIQRDFEKRAIPTEVDVIWSHDSFQYVTNPLGTLKLWNQQMNTNGLLYIGIPLLSYKHLNQGIVTGRNFEFFNHTPLSMIYMLAVNGFDCRDAYIRKQKDDPWFHVAVFKSDVEPLDPSKTSWYDLADKGLIHDSIINSFRKFGQVRQQDLLYTWLDKNLYRIEE